MPPSPAPPPPPPPPPPLAADESPPSDPHRAVPTPFLTKTYHMVDDPTVNDIISWNENGSTFIVWRPADFAHDLLPKYFKHNNFSSFVRQLNTYGFRKIVPDRWEFSNDCFRRGEKRLLCDIHRRKIAAAAAAAPVNRVGSPANSVEEQVISSNSSPTPLPPADLAEENDRLRKENRKLANELSKMKNLCSNIFVLMSKFAGSSPESQPPPPPEAAAAAWCCESSPMLFGVSIGEKRCREMEECEELPLLTASTVKTEPLEVPLPAAAPPPEVAERRPWVVYCPRPQRVCNGKHRVLMEDDGAHVS